ncbi:MAG: hypothetical protein L0L86_06035 [Lactococcus lactis]|nr:hypothetical protein [Lactococcus lactis]
MSKTATIMDLINSELQKQGNSEFVKDGKLVFFDEDEQFIQKIMKYDEDVEKIVTDKFFKGFKFENEQTDHDFKKTFVNQFLDREIMFQTVEKFASQVIRLTLQHEKYIVTAYEKFDEMLVEQNSTDTNTDRTTDTTKDTTNESNRNDESTNDNRELRATLPQDDINMNVDNTEMSYADENTIGKTKQKGEENQKDKGNETGNETGNEKSQTLATNYNIDTLEKLKDIYASLFNIYDRYCFLHVW